MLAENVKKENGDRPKDNIYVVSSKIDRKLLCQ